MILYFDTNIYRFIASLNEARTVRRFLDKTGHNVIASATNLYETYAIRDSSSRIEELKTLTTVASSFETKPESWRQAQEVRREIRRCRQYWLKKIAFTKQAQRFIQAHLQIWEDAKALRPPPAQEYAVYRRDSEAGVRLQSLVQKSIRQDNLKGLTKFQLVGAGKAGSKVWDLDLQAPEVYWRVNSLIIWYNAIVGRAPESRDYADWLDPHIKEGAFSDPTYVQFWLKDVKAENTPRNWVMGLVSYYQERRKITHGNSQDQLHAGNLLSTDVFFTADKAYYEILSAIKTDHLTKTAHLVLLDRGAQSAFEEIRFVLGHASK